MEKHIFKFGESSSAIILPKRWIEKNGIKPTSQIYLSETETGNLIISSNEIAKQDAERVVSSKTKASFIERWVGLHYMYGTGKLRIYSADGFSAQQLERVENKINSDCSGFEITSQSNKDIIIEDLTNIKEINLDKIIMRLRSLINQEFREFKEGDPKTISKIERLVNRFYMLGIRYVNITQAKDSLRYFGVLESIELISDKLQMLASAPGYDKINLFDDLSKQFNESFLGFAGDIKAIEGVAEIRESIISKLSRSKLDKLQIYLLKDVNDSISNIAEFGLRTENQILAR